MIRWLAYPEVKPPKCPAQYLVTMVGSDGTKFVSVIKWGRDNNEHLGGYMFKKPAQLAKTTKVIAWAMLPTPA